MTRTNPSRRAPGLALDFDPEAAEEKALVRTRQAAVAAPGRLYVLRSAGAVLEIIAAGIVGLAIAWSIGVMIGGTGDILGSPRIAVVGGVIVGAVLVGLLTAVAGQLLVAQAAMARNTRLMTAILAELNLTVTATLAGERRSPSVVVSAITEPAPDAPPTAPTAPPAPPAPAAPLAS